MRNPRRSQESEVVMEAARFRQDVVDRLNALGMDVNVSETTTPRRGTGKYTGWGVTLSNPQFSRSKRVSGKSREDVLEFLRDAAADLLG